MVLASVALAACGGGAKVRTGTTITPNGTTPTGTVDKNAYKTSRLNVRQAGEAFINAIAPANDAVEDVAKQLEKLSAGKTADMAKLAAPAAAALTTLNTQLEKLAKDYPVGADDLYNLDQSDQPLIVDFQDLKNVNASNYKHWEDQFTKDVARVKVADKVLRTLLELPASGS